MSDQRKPPEADEIGQARQRALLEQTLVDCRLLFEL